MDLTINAEFAKKLAENPAPVAEIEGGKK